MPAHDSPRVILAANRAADRQRHWCQLVAAADLIFFLVFDTGQPRATGATSGYVSDHVRSSRGFQVDVPACGWRRSPLRPPAGSAASWSTAAPTAGATTRRPQPDTATHGLPVSGCVPCRHTTHRRARGLGQLTPTLRLQSSWHANGRGGPLLSCASHAALRDGLGRAGLITSSETLGSR